MLIWSPHFISFVQSPQRTHAERADEAVSCEMFLFDISIQPLGEKIDWELQEMIYFEGLSVKKEIEICN